MGFSTSYLWTVAKSKNSQNGSPYSIRAQSAPGGVILPITELNKARKTSLARPFKLPHSHFFFFLFPWNYASKIQERFSFFAYYRY